MIKRILLGLGEPATAAAAMAQAIELAQRYAAEITALSMVDVDRLRDVGPVPLGAGEAARHLQEFRLVEAERIVRESLEACEALCRQARVPCRLRNGQGDPIDQLVALARFHDLTVVGLAGLAEHGVVEEPPDALVRLVSGGVRPLVAVAGEHRPIRRAVAALSTSMESARTLRRFVQLRPWPACSLRIVHFAASVEAGRELLDQAAEYCQVHGLPVEVECVAGGACEGVLPYAQQQGADLLVLGNSARSLLLRKLFGETALHVIQASPIPLFLSQ